LLNKVLLIGNLTRDVELRYTQGGLAIGKFGLAVNRRWKDRNAGEDREETMFIDVSLFGKSAEVAHQYVSKGRQVLVEGRLVLEQWTDQNGQKKSRHSISAENLQFLGGGRGESDRASGESSPNYDDQTPQQPPKQQTNQSAQTQSRPTQNVDVNDEEIPF
jgi:single-strand DNA-binding protein